MSRNDIHIFPVRHLSPAGAWHLRRLLDQVRPEVVLVEGLTDATPLIPDMTRRETRPPIAILAYTDAPPVETLVYPLARYSPEYQALAWARAHGAEADFIDLPSDVFLALQDRLRRKIEELTGDAADEEEREGIAEDGAAEESQEEPSVSDGVEKRRVSLYDRIARRSGETDYDSYWERHFEQNLSSDSYRRAAFELGRGLRDLDEAPERSRAEDLVREAFMRRRIDEVIAAGHRPEKIVAVVGAFHAPVLGDEFETMTDDEFESLDRRSSKLTLMPYSYFKLSSQSGYGAGNQAPAYFELLWDALERKDILELPAHYLAGVARDLRRSGTHRSTAEVIEGVRLARTLSALKGGQAPVLYDLQDAAVTLLGHGARPAIQESLARVEIGTAIGELPKGVSQTSIQEDFERELNRLKLAKYKTTVKQELGLDLRENRRAKTEEAAFLDLERSSFLHRLRVLEVGFAEPLSAGQESATWAEKWHVRWTPEAEIELVEAVLLGETVELATSFKFRARLEASKSIDEAAVIVREACECGLMKSMEAARRRLQELASASSEFVAVARAAYQLGAIVRYGDVRRFDPQPLLPLIEELFVEGALALVPAANCDQEAAKQAAVAMDELNRVSLEYSERVDEELWTSRLEELAERDDRNPLLSGYACAILLERGLMSNETLAREVSRRLSPGIDADLGAGWFEGLSRRNRYALLTRQPLWAELAAYVKSLDDEEFRRALVFLRRAFGDFSPKEKRSIVENLGEYWNVNPEVASELVEAPLSEEEEGKLEELNEFDFDDL